MSRYREGGIGARVKSMEPRLDLLHACNSPSCWCGVVWCGVMCHACLLAHCCTRQPDLRASSKPRAAIGQYHINDVPSQHGYGTNDSTKYRQKCKQHAEGARSTTPMHLQFQAAGVSALPSSVRRHRRHRHRHRRGKQPASCGGLGTPSYSVSQARLKAALKMPSAPVELRMAPTRDHADPHSQLTIHRMHTTGTTHLAVHVHGGYSIEGAHLQTELTRNRSAALVNAQRSPTPLCVVSLNGGDGSDDLPPLRQTNVYVTLLRVIYTHGLVEVLSYHFNHEPLLIYSFCSFD